MSSLEQKNLDLQEQLNSQQQMFLITQKHISEQKNLFETQVAERTKELSEANNELVTLLYRTSHDFKSPVASLKGLLQILQTQASDPIAKIIAEKGYGILKTQENMFANLNSYHLIKTIVPVQESIDFYNITESVFKQLEKDFQEIRKIVNIQNTDFHFSTYPALLEIVVKLLIENAVIFSDGKPVTLAASIKDKNLSVQVSDSGEGIADHMSDNVFEMFFRGSTRSKGNGLGLFIVKNAVDKLNGKIKFESREAGGTIFEILIPC